MSRPSARQPQGQWSGPAVTHVMWLNERPGLPAFAGAETHLMVLLPALVRAGVDTELLAIILNEDAQVRQRLRELEARGVRVSRLKVPLARHRFRKYDPRLAYHFLRLVRAIRDRRRRILHLHLDWFFGPVAAAWAGCATVIMSVHCDEPQWASRRWRGWLRVVDPAITRYICISDRVAEYIQAILPSAAGRVRRIYYGLEPPPPGTGRRPVRQELGLPQDAFVVGFVGRLAPQKNLDLLLDAAERLAEVTFVLVGDGPERDRLRTRAARLPNCRLLGYRGDATRLMEAFDLLCLPSRFEGLGLVLVEAMLRGVPVLGSDAGAIPEILGHGRYGIVFDRFSFDALVDAIAGAVADPERLRARAAEASVYARGAYTVEAMAQGTVAVYEEVSAVLDTDSMPLDHQHPANG